MDGTGAFKEEKKDADKGDSKEAGEKAADAGGEKAADAGAEKSADAGGDKAADVAELDPGAEKVSAAQGEAASGSAITIGTERIALGSMLDENLGIEEDWIDDRDYLQTGSIIKEQLTNQ